MLKRNPIRDWLNTEGWNLPKDEEHAGIRTFGHILNQHGIPARRIRIATPVLHPEFRAYTVTWTSETDNIEEFDVPHGWEEDDREFRNSPFHTIFIEGAHAVRCRLTGPKASGDYGILPDLRAAGMTDYAVFRMNFMRLPTTDGAFTIATDRPGGFTKRQLALIDDFIPALAHLSEVFIFEETTKTLMQTYLGRTPGERVIKGQIRRGDGIDIRSVIWFSDLRNSTLLSATLPRDEYLCLLNRYFDCVAAPVLEQGGEVLRYIGDAALAIFPAEDSVEQTRAACVRAVTAAEESRRRLAALNADRTASGLQPIDFGIGLHVGEVTYGNIGVPQRLEFTVIGEAANRAARLQNQCKALRCPIVASEDFARAHGGRWELLGFMNTRDDPAGGASVYGPVEYPDADSLTLPRSKVCPAATKP